MKISKEKSNKTFQKASALILVMLLVSMITSISLFLSTLIRKEVSFSDILKESDEALFHSEEVLEDKLYAYRKNLETDFIENPTCFDLECLCTYKVHAGETVEKKIVRLDDEDTFQFHLDADYRSYGAISKIFITMKVLNDEPSPSGEAQPGGFTTISQISAERDDLTSIEEETYPSIEDPTDTTQFAIENLDVRNNLYKFRIKREFDPDTYDPSKAKKWMEYTISFENGALVPSYVTIHASCKNGSSVRSLIEAIPKFFTFRKLEKQAVITTPIDGSYLPENTELFQWSEGIGADTYRLVAGSTKESIEGNDNENLYFDSSKISNLFAEISGFPQDDSKIYTRLYTYTNEKELFSDALFVTIKTAKIISPLPGSTISGGEATFSWEGGSNQSASEFFLQLGSEIGKSDIFPKTSFGNSTTGLIADIPTDGTTVSLRLTTKRGTQEFFHDCQYKTE